MKQIPRCLRIVIRTIFVSMVVYLCLVVLGTILAMQIPRVAVKTTPASVNLDYQAVTFPSRNPKIILKGWRINTNVQKIIVIVHGGYQNRVDPLVNTLQLSRDLVRRGYSLLLFDLRGRGESSGKALSLLNEDEDIGGAVDYLKTIGYKSGNIGIIGYCSGAASTCVFASSDEVGGIVLDGCFSSLHSIITKQAAAKGIPQWFLDIFYQGLIFVARAIYDFQPLNPIEYVPKIKSPILFIHEENDTLVSATETQTLFQAANNLNSQIWEIKSAAHSEAYNRYSREYVDRLDGFFSTNLH